MSDACSCGWEADSVLGACLMGPRTARSIPKRGNTCGVCGSPVEIGQRCLDLAGLYFEDQGGFFFRMHAPCFDLMERFAWEVCGDGYSWTLPFDLPEAAAHAMAHGDEPFWRDWLFCYERTWSLGGDDGEVVSGVTHK